MKVIIRNYADADCDTVSRLFYETVHAVNAKDYTEIQLDAWAKNADRLKERREDLLKQHTLIAELNGKTVGFGSIDKTGCLDLLYVHKDYQLQGIAAALCDELEKNYTQLTTFASVTAKPFFENRGYTVIKSQEVERFGVKLKNYQMKKLK